MRVIITKASRGGYLLEIMGQHPQLELFDTLDEIKARLDQLDV